MRRTMRLALLGALALGCDDDVAGTPDAGLMVPPGSCAQPGDVGNDIGVGTFCTPRGGECAAFPQAGLCVVMIAPDEGQWFCTRLCDTDADCGADAVCTGDGRGAACVPARCAPEPEDAGTGKPDETRTRDAGAVDADGP